MNKVPALQRGLDIIDTVVSGNYTISQLEEKLEIPKASFNRLIQCLVENEYIKINSSSRNIELGDKAIYQAMQYYEHSIPFRLGMECVQSLSNRWGISFVIHEHCSTGRIYWRVKQAAFGGIVTRPVGFYMKTFNACAQGQLFLSQLSDDMVLKYFTTGPIKKAEYTINTYEEMLPRLNKIRHDGYAYQERENNPYMKQISVPLKLHGYHGNLCLTSYMPLEYDKVDDLLKAMLYETARISGTE